MPASVARASPAACGRLLMTRTIVPPSSARARAASISAARFEPRPEMRTVMRVCSGHGTGAARRRRSDDDGRGCPGRARGHLADLECALAGGFELGDRCGDVARRDGEDEADAA